MLHQVLLWSFVLGIIGLCGFVFQLVVWLMSPPKPKNQILRRNCNED